MKTTFLGQGLESKSVNAIGNHLMTFLNDGSFHSFTGISAFASKSGIAGLARHIENVRKGFEKMTLIVGVDYQGTSKEALIEILNLNIESYVFYQPEPNAIFHPKIYLFEGEKTVKLIIGSSNLTGRGLFVNVENSLLIEFDTTDKEGCSLLDELKAYYQNILSLKDPNLFKLDNELIDYLTAEGIVPDEATVKRIYSKRNVEGITSNEVPSSPKFTIPKRATNSIPQSFQPVKKSSDVITPASSTTAPSTQSEAQLTPISSGSAQPEPRVLFWRSGPLTKRDLNIRVSTNTNPTGSMLFKKGQLTDIDQRHYFRDVVFASLPWVNDTEPRTAHLERATAFFHIIIDGVDCGEFPLILTHNSRTDTPTYEQNNSMTQVSWGRAKDIVAKEELIGKSASLYKYPNTNSNQYTLVIE